MPSSAGAFAEAVVRLAPLDRSAAQAAAEHHDHLTKPPGSLGRLEAVGIRLAAIAGQSPPPVPDPAAVAVFAADHGVVAEAVTPWPQEVTAQMAANVAAGGAAVNVLAAHGGASVVVVDVGVAAELTPMEGLWRRKVRPATRNLAVEAAMTRDEARLALDTGAEVANRLAAAGARCLVTGDMGIGNTTPSAALVAALTGRPPGEVTGRGTGVDDATLARKVTVVERGLARGGWSDAVGLLASVGGLEIGALAGFVVGGAAARVPVVVDGLIAAAATLLAASLAPGAVDYCFAGHRSTEPGASAALDHLGLEPLLDLGLRLGEGSGACLALPVLQAAAKVLREMATFDSAGVSAKGPA